MTRYYQKFTGRGVERRPVALLRRTTDGDPSTDGLYYQDGSWRFNSRLSQWLLHLDDSDIEEVSADEAERFISAVRQSV